MRRSITIFVFAVLIVAESSGGGKGGRGKTEKPPVEVGPPPEAGIVYRDCPVTGVQKFGVFVEVLPGHEGLIHLSELEVTRVIQLALRCITTLLFLFWFVFVFSLWGLRKTQDTQ